MKAFNRYVLLLFCFIIFLFILRFTSTWINSNYLNKNDLNVELNNNFKETFTLKDNHKKLRSIKFTNYLNSNVLDKLNNNHSVNKNPNTWKQIVYKSYFSHQGYSHHSNFEFSKNCRLSNCFDFSKCLPGKNLKINIYPDISETLHSSQISISSTYKKILHIIRESNYYEPDPNKACIFITSYDTLDRDPLSVDFQKNIPKSFALNNGKNHIFFNLYSGTWPSYNEMDFSGFNPGYAIMIKASFKNQDFRPNFDISLPLFSKNHPLRGTTFPIHSQNPNINLNPLPFSIKKFQNNTIKLDKKNLLVFKGKRYIYGIGSETRNMLHHLHNDKDILIYTTCKHGKKWKEFKDEKCVLDNQEYDKYDYNNLILNSTFCLIPRGRRLGSYRFLEALASGCIPVVLSNDWVKPFNSIIDWNALVLNGDERLILHLPEVLRSISWKKIFQMRSLCLKIYDKYFSSIERIILTTFKIIEQRIQSEMSFNSFIWNMVNPGAIWFFREYNKRLSDYPFSNINGEILLKKKKGFTILIFINKPISPSIIFRLLKNIVKSEYLAKVLILWAIPVTIPQTLNESSILFSQKLNIQIIKPQNKNINSKLYPYKEIQTKCVFHMEPDSLLRSEELDFGFQVWTSFPHRIVGFTARDHYYDEAKSSWFYTSKWTNQYSIILLDGAFYHKYYNWLFLNYIANQNLTQSSLNLFNDIAKISLTDDKSKNEQSNSNICLDLVFNFLVSHVTQEPPIKISQRKKTSNQTFFGLALSGGAFSDSQKCFQNLLNYVFNYLPLIKSQVRLDPLLFKDPVSSLRKKYRKMEQFN